MTAMPTVIDRPAGPTMPAPAFSPEQIDLITRTICKGAHAG
jgi:hypothetical protein